MPEAFRHNHPFLAAGTNSSPDGRARWDTPFPTVAARSRSRDAVGPGHCGAASRIRPESGRIPSRRGGGHSTSR
ncbi:hypothetical protein HMPREF1979_00643 [Actinomyces johnsonii F0542]|uniref:Uncharacterized protein n=1 Tax=Actinomyces johnsonii F0542 TaxID=1321818 RepID=U1QTJ9_9ACTO|nr:hypothetical protein HMPREF1979_00643 [Actinomyces johnsonii F0542]